MTDKKREDDKTGWVSVPKALLLDVLEGAYQNSLAVENEWNEDLKQEREIICELQRLAAAPQPAPEREAGRAEGWAEAARFLETLKGADLDGNEFELPADEWRVTALLGVRACADKLGALLARGLRLPSQDDALQQLADLGQQADRAPEPMAWAVVGSDGKMVAINYDRMTAQHLCNPGERVVRVAIRVVEGGDDAA